MKRYFYFICVLMSAILCIAVLQANTVKGEYFRVVQKMGYHDVEEIPFEVVEFTVPEEFDAVYTRYNTLLEEGGYSLIPYKGKKCKRYTYLIPSANARANVIVCDGRIIGGDICGITIDGVMIPIKKE